MLPFRFYLITDRLNTQADPEQVLPGLVGGGLRALQVREKDLSPAALSAYCEGLRDSLGAAAADFGFYLNDRADLALSLGFRGVHLREESLPLSRQAPTLRGALRFGVSTHSLEGVLAAQAAGAEFATFGPVFPTTSKASFGDPVGLQALEKAAAACSLPLLALGGVVPERVSECLAAGAQGVAAISAVWNAPRPMAALAEFQEALGGL